MVAEDGVFMPLAEVVMSQIAAGMVSAAGVATPDPENPGPLLSGTSASADLQIEVENQVMSVASVVVYINDGFTGVDSRRSFADATDTLFVPIVCGEL